MIITPIRHTPPYKPLSDRIFCNRLSVKSGLKAHSFQTWQKDEGHKYNGTRGCMGRHTVKQIFQFYHKFNSPVKELFEITKSNHFPYCGNFMFLSRSSIFQEIREEEILCVIMVLRKWTLTTEWPSERILQAIEWAMTDKHEPANSVWKRQP